MTISLSCQRIDRFDFSRIIFLEDEFVGELAYFMEKIIIVGLLVSTKSCSGIIKLLSKVLYSLKNITSECWNRYSQLETRYSINYFDVTKKKNEKIKIVLLRVRREDREISAFAKQSKHRFEFCFRRYEIRYADSNNKIAPWTNVHCKRWDNKRCITCLLIIQCTPSA